MELRHLRYFLAVAEDLHFGRAAERIHIAQPPLSQQIKQLETEIGVQLFKRTKRNVELTEAGKVFQREAYAVLERLDKGVLKAQLADRGEAGWIGIAFLSSINYEVLPNVIRKFRNHYPNIEMFLQEKNDADQNQALLERRVHVGFTRFPIANEELESKVILRENVIIAMPASHPLANKPKIRLADLANESFIMFSQNQPSAYADYLSRLCAEAGFQPRVVQNVGEMQTAIGLVAAEIGIIAVPSSIQNLKREGVVYRSLDNLNATIEITVQYRKDETSPVLQRFLEIVNSLYPFE
jgi:DNA-binding transcriptional LysR family regulator